MAKITYLLGAGASYYACPILEKQAEMMIKLANHLLSNQEFYDKYEIKEKVILTFKLEEFEKIPQENKFQIAWYIGYFGKKAQEYNTIDTYARKLFLNNEDQELRLLKMSVSVFFDLWENFYFDGLNFLEPSNYIKIDNRYKALFSVLLDNENGKIKLNNEFKFITWNYDLQLEETFGMFLGDNNASNLNDINSLFRFKEKQTGEIENNVFHLNGHRGFFSDTTSRNDKEEFQINLANNIDGYWKKIDWLFDSTERGTANFDSYIKYAWEHNLIDSFFNKISQVLEETEVLVIIGYSFPAFNRKIDQFLFSNLNKEKIKKIIYQDPNANEQIIENLFYSPEVYKKKIEIINEDKSLKQFHLPNEYFIIQEETKPFSTTIRV